MYDKLANTFVRVPDIPEIKFPIIISSTTDRYSRSTYLTHCTDLMWGYDWTYDIDKAIRFTTLKEANKAYDVNWWYFNELCNNSTIAFMAVKPRPWYKPWIKEKWLVTNEIKFHFEECLGC